MDENDIRQKRDALVERFGPWTGHCIHLGENIHTLRPQVNARLRRILQIAADVVGEQLDNIRVADLACLEGLFGIELAPHGAEVVGIEGRSTNFVKTEFAKNILCREKYHLVLDDVRNFNREKYGKFDVILCLGILYHLDAPDVMKFVQNIFDCCDRIAIFDTHISLNGTASYVWNGKEYFGHYAFEHESESQDEQGPKLWHSLHNLRSFWFTIPSLCNLLRHVGFTSVYETLNPY